MSNPPQDLLLSVNAGSSSLKISVFHILPTPTAHARKNGAEPVSLLLTSSVEQLTAPPATFSFKPSSELAIEPVKDAKVKEIDSHEHAFSYFLDFLEKHTSAPSGPGSKSSEDGDKEDFTFKRERVKYVCHRVVHGGRYAGPVRITQETYHHIETLSDLAPLHNGRALTVISACLSLLPAASSIAFFDSMFHSTLPTHVSRYAISPEVAEAKGLRKYGFHGLSYAFILRSVASFLKKPASETSLIVMHLGSGASVCAIKNGKSIDTSMGLTPLDGLPGATRSGAVDASLIFHYTNDAARISRQAAEAVDITDAEEILNKESGWKSLAGTTNFAEIAAHATDPSSQYAGHRLAYALLVDRILHFVGAYFLKLGGASGVDALVFSGGIGERSAALRESVASACACVGFGLDKQKNEGVDNVDGVVMEIGEGQNGVKTFVCRTDEQFEMARECILQDNFIE